MDYAPSSGAGQQINNDNRVWSVHTAGPKGFSSDIQLPSACQAPQGATLISHERKLPSISSVFENRAPTLQAFLGSPNFGSSSHAVPASLESPEPFLKRPRLSSDLGPVTGPTVSDDIVTVKTSKGMGPENQQESRREYTSMYPDSGCDLRCSHCTSLRPLIQKVVLGVVDLDAEIRQASVKTVVDRPSQSGNGDLPVASGMMDADAESSLTWAITVILSGVSLIRDLMSGPSLPFLVPKMSEHVSPASHPECPTTKAGPSDMTQRRGTVDASASGIVTDDGVAFRQGKSPQSMANDESKGGCAADLTASFSSQSPRVPHSSPGRSMSQQPSNFIGPPSGALPSPPSLHSNFNMSHLCPLSPSPSLSASAALAAHLQDLQHQISTKTLALQTLQREYESLLAAFSRQQTRYSTLDKKTKVSDIEIKTLSEEKLRLQSQVETLESQVEELIRGREEYHQQSVASGAQYMQIMAMSSRLQAQGASDSKRWKAEKEKWDKEKQEMTKRIKDLEAAASLTRETDPGQSNSLRVTRASASAGFGSDAASLAIGDILASTSITTLRSEVLRLQRCCQDMELTLKEFRNEAEDLDEFMHKFMNFSRRLKDQTGRGRLQPQSEAQPFQEQEAHTVAAQADRDD